MGTTSNRTFTYRVKTIMPEFNNIDEIVKPSDLVELASKIRAKLVEDSGYTKEQINVMVGGGKLNIKFRNKKVMVKIHG